MLARSWLIQALDLHGRVARSDLGSDLMRALKSICALVCSTKN
jgi:hypothetical protein